MFWKNLGAFLLGVSFQVAAGVWPRMAGVFIAPGSLLLSLSDIRPVMDGSFAKHMGVMILGVACQACAVAFPERWGASGPLLAAGGILMNVSDVKRVLKGPEKPAAPLTATGLPTKDPP